MIRVWIKQTDVSMQAWDVDSDDREVAIDYVLGRRPELARVSGKNWDLEPSATLDLDSDEPLACPLNPGPDDEACEACQ